jgi:hypothetical protein
MLSKGKREAAREVLVMRGAAIDGSDAVMVVVL